MSISQAYSTWPTTPFDRARCPKCDQRMVLESIEPGPPGHDLRTFECPSCQQVETVLIQFR
jgi:hypothetical protein